MVCWDVLIGVLEQSEKNSGLVWYGVFCVVFFYFGAEI